jgi:ribosome-associated heat shock protein Hsp15
MTGSDDGLRLDKWLWFARLAKTRSLAARLCAAGQVSVGGTATLKASHTVRVGDLVVVPQGPFIRTVRVLALGTRRGPAPEAQALYREEQPPVRARDIAAASAEAWTPLLED